MPNRLTGEASPYLKQHADNPVDWYPWGEEALTLARTLDRPILLSIGYSACHWCHVMAHESFEDPDTAALMNALFVNIKVDREERPDLDQIYQQAHILLARRSGGWPLTVVLSPDQVPFFGGTYFPPVARYGMPAFRDVLMQVGAAWREHRADIERQNLAVLEALGHAVRQDAAGIPETPDNAVEQALSGVFDTMHGGFGGAPKFPKPPELALLLHGTAGARAMALFTLEHMARGGLFDHVGGGFFRYSVDARWEIPHFEKMLYDNGQLLALYADAWRLSGQCVHREALTRTALWLLHEMRSPQGWFYAALDADSAGEEGRYYVWDAEEITACLTPEEQLAVQQGYGLGHPPNFEGRWHLQQTATLAVVDSPAWISARGKLAAVRAARVRPLRDEKLLCGWNALAIGGLARAARACKEAMWADAARAAMDALRQRLWMDGRLHAHGGTSAPEGYLDDHVFLLEALLELMQTEFHPEDLTFAVEVADALLARFEDGVQGGFFFTGQDHEPLILRAKPAYDGVTPNGNGLASQVLQRLGHILGEARYLKAAARTLHAFGATVAQFPVACPGLLRAQTESRNPPTVLLLYGPRRETWRWQAAVEALWLPSLICLRLPENGTELPPVLQRPHTKRVNAWLCRGVECLPAITSLEALLETLQTPLQSG